MPFRRIRPAAYGSTEPDCSCSTPRPGVTTLLVVTSGDAQRLKGPSNTRRTTRCCPAPRSARSELSASPVPWPAPRATTVRDLETSTLSLGLRRAREQASSSPQLMRRRITDPRSRLRTLQSLANLVNADSVADSPRYVPYLEESDDDTDRESTWASGDDLTSARGSVTPEVRA